MIRRGNRGTPRRLDAKNQGPETPGPRAWDARTPTISYYWVDAGRRTPDASKLQYVDAGRQKLGPLGRQTTNLPHPPKKTRTNYTLSRDTCLLPAIFLYLFLLVLGTVDTIGRGKLISCSSRDVVWYPSTSVILTYIQAQRELSCVNQMINLI